MRIKEIMKRKGVGMEQLAQKLNISRQALSRKINGECITINSANDIASALDVPLWQLFISPEQLEEEREKKRKGFSAIIKDGAKCYTADNWEEVCDLYIKHKNGSLV